MRNHIGLDFAGTNTAREGFDLPPMTAGRCVHGRFSSPASRTLSLGVFLFTRDRRWNAARLSDLRLGRQRHRAADESGRRRGLRAHSSALPGGTESQLAAQRRSSRTRSRPLVEFTGERVIPGQVNDDLWSEHVARYAFARRYAHGKRVLDAGCGTGYGSAELAQSAAAVTGVDISADAIEYAQRQLPDCQACASWNRPAPPCPCPRESFDLVVAFEVIEHLTDYRAFLNECARVLTREGLFIVSSPNKRYYAETRAATGPNPFHEHEFEAEEFVRELEQVFSECPAAAAESRGVVRVSSSREFLAGGGAHRWRRRQRGGRALLHRHLFARPVARAKVLCLCSESREYSARARTARGGASNSSWRRSKRIARRCSNCFRRQTRELEERNRWAQGLDADLKAAGERIRRFAKRSRGVGRGLSGASRAAWNKRTRSRPNGPAKLRRSWKPSARNWPHCVSLLDTAEATVRERTMWAQTAEAQRAELAAQLEMIRASRWVKMGRTVGLGPEI